MAENEIVEDDLNPESRVEKFSLILKEEVIEIEGKDGVAREYILRELDGDARDNYVNLMIAKSKTDKSGRTVGVSDVRGLESALLTRMLFNKEDNSAVPQAQIQKWPAGTRTRLYERALRLCGLDKSAEENAKNG